MIMAAVQNGWLDRERAMLESLMAFKRAGCSGVYSPISPLKLPGNYANDRMDPR